MDLSLGRDLCTRLRRTPTCVEPMDEDECQKILKYVLSVRSLIQVSVGVSSVRKLGLCPELTHSAHHAFP